MVEKTQPAQSPRRPTRVTPGDVLRDWQVEKRIGRGTFGEVWKASWSSMAPRPEGTPELVAMKIVEPGDGLMESALQEVVATRGLSHTNLLPIYQWWVESNHRLIIVMELADGNLQEWIDNNGAMQGSAATSFVQQVLEAVAFFHTLPVPLLHLDLRPENVLWKAHGTDVRWLVSDFGITKTLHKSYTVTGQFNQDLIPPEALRQGEMEPAVLTHRWDVWAIGLVIHLALTGEIAFGRRSRVDRAIAIVMGDLSVVDSVAPDLWSVVEAALASDPADRPINGRELLDLYSHEHGFATSSRSHFTPNSFVEMTEAETEAKPGMPRKVRKRSLDSMITVTELARQFRQTPTEFRARVRDLSYAPLAQSMRPFTPTEAADLAAAYVNSWTDGFRVVSPETMEAEIGQTGRGWEIEKIGLELCKRYLELSEGHEAVRARYRSLLVLKHLAFRDLTNEQYSISLSDYPRLFGYELGIQMIFMLTESWQFSSELVFGSNRPRFAKRLWKQLPSKPQDLSCPVGLADVEEFERRKEKTYWMLAPLVVLDDWKTRTTGFLGLGAVITIVFFLMNHDVDATLTAVALSFLSLWAIFCTGIILIFKTTLPKLVSLAYLVIAGAFALLLWRTQQWLR
jgi:serine/threonine protein kinase